MSVTILKGDCREMMRTLPAGSVHTCVTSPPYWGLRDYGVEGQLGLEATPEEYVAKMVEVFREVKRVLRDDGTLWLNLGDSYAGNSAGGFRPGAGRADGKADERGQRNRNGNGCPEGLKPKDLVGIPWMVAFALRADGWYLRSDIIWHKPNPMPESVTDRPTKAHEYIFLLTKSPSYYYDHEAIKEPATGGLPGNTTHKHTTAYEAGDEKARTKAGLVAYAEKKRSARDSFKRESSKREQAIPGQSVGTHRPDREESDYSLDTRNKRSVWTVSTKPFSGAHFATFPPDLIEPCIKAGSSERGCCPTCGAGWVRQTTKERHYDHTTTAAGKSKDGPYASQTGDGAGTHDIRHGVTTTTTTTTTTTGWEPSCGCDLIHPKPCTVLDPFGGAGTTGLVSDRQGRHAVLCELNPEYIGIAEARLNADSPLFSNVESL